MSEANPTSEQMKEAEAQFDKLSPTQLMQLGKRIGMMMGVGGARNALKTMGSMQIIISKLKNLSKKAKKAEAKGDFTSARKYGKEMQKILEEQKAKADSSDILQMLQATETDVNKSMKNLDIKEGV